MLVALAVEHRHHALCAVHSGVDQLVFFVLTHLFAHVAGLHLTAIRFKRSAYHPRKVMVIDCIVGVLGRVVNEDIDLTASLEMRLVVVAHIGYEFRQFAFILDIERPQTTAYPLPFKVNVG